MNLKIISSQETWPFRTASMVLSSGNLLHQSGLCGDCEGDTVQLCHLSKVWQKLPSSLLGGLGSGKQACPLASVHPPLPWALCACLWDLTSQWLCCVNRKARRTWNCPASSPCLLSVHLTKQPAAFQTQAHQTPVSSLSTPTQTHLALSTKVYRAIFWVSGIISKGTPVT